MMDRVLDFLFCTVSESPEVSCSDGVDNDCDGLVDGDDPSAQRIKELATPFLSVSRGVRTVFLPIHALNRQLIL